MNSENQFNNDFNNNLNNESNNNLNDSNNDTMQYQNQNIISTQNTISNNKNKKKKLIICILCLLIIIAIILIVFVILNKKDNDDKPIDNNPVVENDSQTYQHINDDIHDDLNIQYITFLDRKIELLDNFNDFINQFRGLGCKYRITGVTATQKLDEQDENYFEKLMVPDYANDSNNEVDINCGNQIYDQDDDFRIYFVKNDEDSQEMYYKDKTISSYKIRWGMKTSNVVFDKTSINIGMNTDSEYLYNETYERFGQYNDWTLIDKSLDYSKLTYYGPKYNFSFYYFAKGNGKDITQKKLSLAELDIEKK